METHFSVHQLPPLYRTSNSVPQSLCLVHIVAQNIIHSKCTFLLRLLTHVFTVKNSSQDYHMGVLKFCIEKIVQLCRQRDVYIYLNYG